MPPARMTPMQYAVNRATGVTDYNRADLGRLRGVIERRYGMNRQYASRTSNT